MDLTTECLHDAIVSVPRDRYQQYTNTGSLLPLAASRATEVAYRREFPHNALVAAASGQTFAKASPHAVIRVLVGFRV